MWLEFGPGTSREGRETEGPRSQKGPVSNPRSTFKVSTGGQVSFQSLRSFLQNKSSEQDLRRADETLEAWGRGDTCCLL